MGSISTVCNFMINVLRLIDCRIGQKKSLNSSCYTKFLECKAAISETLEKFNGGLKRGLHRRITLKKRNILQYSCVFMVFFENSASSCYFIGFLSKLRRVLDISIAIVIGPTPPGTGVIELNLGAT